MVEDSSAAPTDLPGAPNRGNLPTFLDKQDEGVLRDVLQELDKERSQRAELQAKIRILEQQGQSDGRHTASSAFQSPDESITRGDRFFAMEAERDGYLQLVEALTKDRPAFSKQQRLPLHVVRLLEIVPWDPRARHHLFGDEALWEWQILGADKTWQARLRFFPTIFKTMPVVAPRAGKTVGEAPTSSSPPKQCVLTNIEVTQIWNIDKGYPLPQDGGDWVWIGGWRIEKHSEADEDGWSYSNDLDLTLDLSYYAEFRPPQLGTPNLVKRRRKWTRTRVLVDYPQASIMTKEFLKLLAEKASLDVSVNKLSSQLVETKMKLTTMESDHLTLQEETSRKISQLERELEEKNKLLEAVQQHGGIDASTLATKKDQVKELRSSVTAWVSGTVAKRQMHDAGINSDKSAAEASNVREDGVALDAAPSLGSGIGSNDVTQMVFGSLKGKSADFFEKIKQKGGEELEKIKKQNKGRSPWTPTSTRKSTNGESEQAHVNESVQSGSSTTEA
jgi:hypothetical protein